MRVAMLAAAAKRHVIDWSNFLVGEGVDLTVCSDVEPDSKEYDERVKFLHPSWSLFQNIVTYKLRPHMHANSRDKWKVYLPLIKNLRPQIVHAQEALGYGPVLPKINDIPKVLTPWGPDIEKVQFEPETLAAELVKNGARSADIISTNANGLEDHWSKLLGVNKDRFDFFPWGIDESIFHEAAEGTKKQLREKWNLPLDHRIVFNSRVPLQIYRTSEVVEAWKKSTAENSYLILITGGCKMPDAWKDLDHPSITLIDRKLSLQEMAELYQLADFSMNLPETDLVAQSLLEGMACGCVPINCRNACYEFMIRDGAGEGVWVDPDDTDLFSKQIIDALAMESSLLNEMQKVNAEYIAANYRKKDCRSKMLDVYEKVLTK